MTAATAAAMGGRFDGGLPKIAAMQEGEAGVEAEQLAVQLWNRDGFHSSRQRRDDWIILHVEAGKDLGDDGDAVVLPPGEAAVDDEVERGGAPEVAPPGGEDLGAGAFPGGEERDDVAENVVG